MHSLSFAYAMTVFARASAGFYILNSSHPEVARFGFVKVEFAPDNAWAGFIDLISSRYAPVRVDASGDIGTSFVLRSVGNETWGMLSRQGTSVQVRLVPSRLRRLCLLVDGLGVNANNKLTRWGISPDRSSWMKIITLSTPVRVARIFGTCASRGLGR